MTKSAHESNSSASRGDTQIPPFVAANVHRLRLAKGYSLEQLALSSGVARGTLEQLEAGDHEPTIKTLWSLATALSVPFSALIAPDTGKAEARRDSSPPSGTSSRKVLASRDGASKSEVYELKLQARASQTASAGGAGAQENVLVTSGRARIEAGGQLYTLSTGEAVIFAADGARTYTNLSDEETTLYVVVSQPSAS
jgi:transcriptional regulator with XRE-family HTH domain